MSYHATVIKVMIASPCDVAEERQIIREVIHEWNDTHSEDKSLVLMPVAWESHATPAMGERPQGLINKQVLADCDLLMAVFWSRVGTPTGQAASGTIEEIQEHVKARKPAMVYFSSVPCRLENLDEEQHKALAELKKQVRMQGLYAEYDSLEHFRKKLARQLAQTIIRHFASRSRHGQGHDEWLGPNQPADFEQPKAVLINEPVAL